MNARNQIASLSFEKYSKRFSIESKKSRCRHWTAANEPFSSILLEIPYLVICTLEPLALVMLELAVRAMVVGGVVRPHQEDGEIFSRVIILWKRSVRYLPAQRSGRLLEVSPVLFDGGDVAVAAVGVELSVVDGVAHAVAGTAVPSAIANDTR